jgi:hypothetical protein
VFKSPATARAPAREERKTCCGSWALRELKVAATMRSNYARTHHRPKIAARAEGQTRFLLVVRLRRLEDPAVLRRLTQRHRLGAEEGGHHRGKDGGLVRLQAHQERAVLRRSTFPNLSAVGGQRRVSRRQPEPLNRCIAEPLVR